MLKNIPCTKCFSILGVDSRMEIYEYLRESGPSTVTKVVDFIGLTQPTVSYHLKEMKEVGLLHSTKEGKKVFYMVSGYCTENNGDCVLNSIKFPVKNDKN